MTTVTTWPVTCQDSEETSSITWQMLPLPPAPAPHTHEEGEDTGRIVEQCIQGMLTWWFRGAASLPQCPPDTMIAGNLDQLVTFRSHVGSSVAQAPVNAEVPRPQRC